MSVVTTVWEEFLDIVRQEVGSRVVETWFKAVSLLRWDFDQKTVYLQAPNVFVQNWLISKYMTLIQTHLARLLHVDMLKITFVQHEKNEAVIASSAPVHVPVVVNKSPSAIVSTYKTTSYINTQYVFENFVVGPSNSLAYAAAQAVAEKPGSLYNPLFIYGESGLGKTHLLYAIGNSVKSNNPNALVLYQTADRFVNEFISAIRFDKVHKFKSKYQNIDVLLIDDIQFISNKEQTQEAFFHIFNTLHEAHKQIVFSSDMVPQDLKGVAVRLRSRMAWGLVTDIHTPKFETKIAILKKKAQVNNELLSDEVAHFIADCVDSNIRELEGALVRVMAFAALTKQSITIELVQKVLSVQKYASKKEIDLEYITDVVSKYYHYNLRELQSKSRNKEIAHVRHIAIFLMKKHTNKSLRDIGLFLGGRDHSTIVHAYSKIEQELMGDQCFAQKVQMLEKEIAR